MLRASGIGVRIGRKQILGGLDFEAAPGAVTAIVGPNGSGKSTLLKAITGDLPHSGRISLDGTALATMTARDLAARRGVLPQGSTLAFPFTVAEVVAIGLHHGAFGAEAAIASRALDRVGLGGFGGRFYQELSGGEQQRVQLARVLAQVWEPLQDGRPRWLFLDEPVSALDIAHQLQVMRIARDYADAGGGVVTVMHDLNLTAMFADRVAVLAQGRCLAAGTPAEVMTDATLGCAYGCALHVGRTPPPGTPFLLPHTAATV